MPPAAAGPSVVDIASATVPTGAAVDGAVTAVAATPEDVALPYSLQPARAPGCRDRAANLGAVGLLKALRRKNSARITRTVGK
jgi:hypothetical protein